MRCMWFFRNWKTKQTTKSETSREARVFRQFLREVSSDGHKWDALAFLIDRRFVSETYRLDETQIGAAVESIFNGEGMDLLDPNPWFDTDFYYRNSSTEIEESGLSPFKHFLVIGRDRQLPPNPGSSFIHLNDDDISFLNSLSGDQRAICSHLFSLDNAYRLAESRIRSDSSERMSSKTVPVSDVAILIPTFNNWLWTERCLRSLERCPDVEMAHVWVVDDGSTDFTCRKISERFPQVNVIENEANLGFLRSCNGAYRKLNQYPFVFLLNNDAEPLPNFLDECRSAMESDDSIAIVASQLFYPDGLVQDAGGIIWRDASGWNYGNKKTSTLFTLMAREIDYATGAAMLLRRSAVGEQLFDDNFAPAYYEDTDLSFRCRQKGFSVVYCPSSRVVHHEGKSHGTNVAIGTKKFQEINRIKFEKKWKATLASHHWADPFGVDYAAFRLNLASKSKTILWIDYQLPDPTRDSGSVRAVALMEIFLSLGFLVVFVTENGDVRQLNPTPLLNRGVFVCRNMNEAKKVLSSFGREPDLIFSSRVSTTKNLGRKAKESFTNAKFIFDTVDLHFLRLQRAYEQEPDAGLLAASLATKADEINMVLESDVTFVVSDFERRLLLEIDPEFKIEVVSNVHEVNSQAFSGVKRGLVFVGSFNHHPNEQGIRWFIQKIWPLLPDTIKNEGLTIVGPNPPSWLLGYDDDRIRVTGWVPESKIYVANAKASIAPLLVGAGVKGKVGESIANYTPVIGTSIALEGMKLKHLVSCFEANTPSEFAKGIIKIMADQELRLSMAKHAAESLDLNFGKQTATLRITQVLEELGIL